MGSDVSCSRCCSKPLATEGLSDRGERDLVEVEGDQGICSSSGLPKSSQSEKYTWDAGPIGFAPGLEGSPSDDDEETCHQKLKSGNQVVIQGMQSATDLNGQFAILQQFDRSKQRWIVWLTKESRPISAKSENLRLHVGEVPTSSICVDDPISLKPEAGDEKSTPSPSVSVHVDVKPDSNFSGAKSTGSTSADTNKREPHLSVNGSTAPTNGPGSFQPGECVTIVNMQSAVHLNGQIAVLQNFVASTGRWILALDEGGKLVSAKADNLRPHSRSKSQTEKIKRGQAESTRQDGYEKFGQKLEENGCKQQ